MRRLPTSLILVAIAVGCSSSPAESANPSSPTASLTSATETPSTSASGSGSTTTTVAPATTVTPVTTSTTVAPTTTVVPTTTAVLDLRVSLVRGRADMVTGGDVVVAVSGADVGEADWSLAVDGAPAEATAHPDGLLLTGLAEGASTIEVVVDGHVAATLALVNHLITGPVFSGPHVTPFFCTLDDFGLDPAPNLTSDGNCSAVTKVTWWAHHWDGSWSELVDPTDRTTWPEDLKVTDGHGGSTPFVVRRESGTINRAVYDIAVVDDPAAEVRAADWNGVLHYRFGGGCGSGRTQGSMLATDVLHPDSLADGNMVATSTFNTFNTACDDVLSAETLMMVTEHIVETVRNPRYVVGQGGSGGAIQQYLINQNYPGLLDASNTLVSYPDAFSISPGVTDCGLLNRYYGSPVGSALTTEQRTAINGHGTPLFCAAWAATFLPLASPSVGCHGSIPAEAVYDPDTNPTGVRCTQQDSLANLLPRHPDTGHVDTHVDNVGIEYGRQALVAGKITVDQFLDLNEHIGGYWLDGEITDDRRAADPAFVEHVYTTGRVNQGGGSNRTVPTVDVDLYTDLGFDIHDRFRLFSIRERHRLDDGSTAGNRVIWTQPGGNLMTSLGGAGGDLDPVAVVATLVRWLEALDEAGVGPATRAEGIAPTRDDLLAARPDGLADDCFVDGVHLVGDDVYDGISPDSTTCTAAYPIHGDPRTAAGAPLANDIVKCTLTSVDPGAYGVPFSDAQADRLVAVFPDGVCDWSLPGVGQVPLRGTWLRY